MSVPAYQLPHAAPYTVDDLFELPDDGNRYEVVGGSLIVSPAAGYDQQLAADALGRLLWPLIRPRGLRATTNIAVRLANDDGPIPDLTVTDTPPARGAVLAEHVYTVVEVVSPSSMLMDRATKRELYAEAGIPCYWRVELHPWRAYQGPLPLIVVRLRDGDGWQTIEAAAGTIAELPLAVGPTETILVKLDPADLVDP
jgi:Uma2 family endonuclease